MGMLKSYFRHIENKTQKAMDRRMEEEKKMEEDKQKEKENKLKIMQKKRNV